MILDFVKDSYRRFDWQLPFPRLFNRAERDTLWPGITFSRSGADRWEDGLKFSAGVPALVAGAGLYIRPALTNKCTNWNVAPTDLTNVSKTGDAAAVLSVVDDTAALQAVPEFARALTEGRMNGKVFKLDNSAGTTNAEAAFAPGPGNSNAHTLLAYVRGSGTATLIFAGGATSAAATLGSGYVRLVAANQTTVNTTNSSRVRANPGSVVYFIANHLIEASADPGCIVPVAGAAATVNADETAFPLPSGSPTDVIEIVHSGGTVTGTRATLAPGDVLNLGVSSGGAWVNNYIERVTVRAI